MARAARELVARELVARCHAGLDAVTLKSEFVERLGALIPVDAVFCASVDPATLLFTGAVLHEIPVETTSRFLVNEFLEDDVNKFSALARRPVAVDWLDRATADRRSDSRRYREIMAPLGLGDELRAAFRSGGECWGFLCLHRDQSSVGFNEADARLIARLSAHVGEGLRRALLVGVADASTDSDAPGVLLIGRDGSVEATTAAGDRWLWELSGPGRQLGVLPVSVQAVLARLDAVGRGVGDLNAQPRVRVRTRSRRWAVLHASAIAGLDDGRHVAVVVESAKPAELAPMILLAYGLTTREAEVAQLALQGRPTKAVARELRISENTVEDHLKAIFTKVGVGSRGELTARVFTEHYAQ